MSNFAPGDLARVIESLDGACVGIVVQLREYRGEHSLYGSMWRCSSRENIVTEFGSRGNEADFPAKWLKKIEPGDLDLVKEVEHLRKSDKIVELLKNV